MAVMLSASEASRIFSHEDEILRQPPQDDITTKVQPYPSMQPFWR